LEQKKELYVNNIVFDKFLNLFSENDLMLINSLFAHSTTKEYDQRDFPKELSIRSFKKFKNENANVFLDKINFSVDSVWFDIADEHEYVITAVEPHFRAFKKKLFELILIDDRLLIELENKGDMYVLVEKCEIVQCFASFDEFLESDYSNL
jgi:hypothetical protein